jgi:hypothetical protein
MLICSCTSKTNNETRLLLEKVFEIGRVSGDSTYFSTNSLVDWLDIAGIDSCTLDEFAVLEDIYHRRMGNEIKLSSIFRKKDFEKICSKGRANFEFDKALIPRNFIPKEQRYFDSLYMSYKDALSTLDPTGLRLLEMNQLYYRLSKPIFLQNYRYAVIGFSYESFIKNYGGCSILVFEKKEDEWSLIFTSQICPFT